VGWGKQWMFARISKIRHRMDGIVCFLAIFIFNIDSVIGSTLWPV